MSTLTSPAVRFAQLTVEPMLGGISIAGLASLLDRNHEANKPIKFQCSQGCGAELTGPQFFASLTCCDACRSKADKATYLERAKTYWESICPPSFRETDKEHAGFPKAQYAATSTFSGTESLLLYGPPRRGKTRLGMLLLKRCLVRFNLHVGVMWPEQLKATKKGFDPLQQIEKWGRYDVLLMDDALLSGAQDERVVDFLKDLLDYRMRYKRHQIITSQIGATNYKEAAGKFQELKKADEGRIDAMLGRVREIARVISFADTEPKQNEVDF